MCKILREEGGSGKGGKGRREKMWRYAGMDIHVHVGKERDGERGPFLFSLPPSHLWCVQREIEREDQKEGGVEGGRSRGRSRGREEQREGGREE